MARQNTKTKSRFSQMLDDVPGKRVIPGERHQRAIRPRGISGSSGGAPPIYDPVRFPHIANVLAKEYGFTNGQLASVFGVSIKTVDAWMIKYKEFKEAFRAGKDEFDGTRVENALLKIALGYKYEEKTTRTIRLKGKSAEGDKIVCPATEITVTTKELPPNPRAIAFWLTNRQKERWQMVTTVNANIHAKTEHTTRKLNFNADLSKMNSEQLKALRDMVATQNPLAITDESQEKEEVPMLELMDKAQEVIDAQYTD